jgi:hypothetical protein
MKCDSDILVIKDQVIVSTTLDAHGEKIPKDIVYSIVKLYWNTALGEYKLFYIEYRDGPTLHFI